MTRKRITRRGFVGHRRHGQVTNVRVPDEFIRPTYRSGWVL